MAATLTDFVLDAGFTGDDVIDTLGEALALMGFLPTATGWRDDYTHADGRRQVSFSQSIGTGPRAEWTHTFCFNPLGSSDTSSYWGLYYNGGYYFDEATHKVGVGVPTNEGGSGWDYPPSIQWFGSDDVSSSTSLVRYVVGMANFYPSMPMTITAIVPSSGKMKFLYFHGRDEHRLYGFYDANATLNTDLRQPFDYAGSQFCPVGLHCYSPERGIFGQACALQLHRAQCGIGVVSNNVTSTGGNIWVAEDSLTGTMNTSGTAELNSYQAMVSYTSMRPPAIGRDTSLSSNNGYALQASWKYTASATEVPVSRHVYSDVHTGEVGWMTVSELMNIAPEPGDKVIVAAGGEEYLVLKAFDNTAAMSYYAADHTLIVVRVV